MKKHLKLFCATIVIACIARSLISSATLTQWMWMYIACVGAAGMLSLISYYEEF